MSAPRTTRASSGVARQQAVLAAIARREWLLRMLVLGAAGCRRGRPRASEDMLTISVPLGEWEALFTDSSSQFLLFLPLVTRNAKGELEGRLAERWEHTPDYGTWTIHLRRDVRWQDGVPVTAHDIKFTLDLLFHPDVHYGPPGSFSVFVLDDSTYTITYHRQAIVVPGGESPGAGSPFDDYTVFYPKHLLENLEPKEFKNWEFWTHPVGNGPYRYVRHVPQTMVEFAANPEYYRGKPRIERVALKFRAGDDGSALTELLSGNVQAIFYFGQDLLKIGRDPRFLTYHSLSASHLSAIMWNQRHPLFGDASVLRALTFAINRRELDQARNMPEGIPILDVIPTGRQFRRGEFPDPLPYDPERAKRLLDEAGWRDVNGVRQRSGLSLRFTTLTQVQLEKAAVYIQAQLRGVGIQMDVQTVDYSILQRRVKASQFQAAMYFVNLKPTSLLALFGEGSPIGYSNPSVIALLEQLQTTLDPDEIDRIYRALMPIFPADMPVTFLSPLVEWMEVSRHVRGLSSPYRSDVVQYMEDLWIEE